MSAKHHDDCWTKLISNWNPAISTKQKGGKKEDQPRDGEDDLNIYQQPDRYKRDNNDLTSDTTWLTSAEDGTKWDAMASDCTSSRLKRSARPTISITTTTTTQPTTDDQTTSTTEVHDQNGALPWLPLQCTAGLGAVSPKHSIDLPIDSKRG